MIKLLVIGAGGFLGAVARYLVSGVVHRLTTTPYPWGTLAVNLIGCFLLGGLMYLVQSRGMFTPNMRLFLAIGLLGAFTTFSTFGYETVQLVNSREMTLALLNIGANLVLGLLAVWLGSSLLRLMSR